MSRFKVGDRVKITGDKSSLDSIGLDTRFSDKVITITAFRDAIESVHKEDLYYFNENISGTTEEWYVYDSMVSPIKINSWKGVLNDETN